MGNFFSNLQFKCVHLCQTAKVFVVLQLMLNHLTHTNDQDRISPYNIYTTSTR